MRVLQHKHNVIVTCQEDDAQYIQIGDIYYHADWMRKPSDIGVDIQLAEVKAIAQDEYDSLYEAFQDNQDSIIEDVDENEYIVETEIQEPVDTTTIDFIRSSKISAMSAACHNIIISGIDVKLSDNNEHHFDLTVNDQLNLISLKDYINNGITAIPYHASDEICKFYSPEDITIIINAATALKTYHTTYFNSLKQYILSLDNIEDIQNVEYGIEIPINFKTEVLIALEQGAIE